jgi:hypothetical protein
MSTFCKKGNSATKRQKGYVEVFPGRRRAEKGTTESWDAFLGVERARSAFPRPTDVKEILHQSLAEYAERLATAIVTPDVRVADGLVSKRPTGGFFWRVMDNL